MLNLDDIKKENNFKVPEGYFEDFPLRLQEKMQYETPEKPRINVFRSLKAYVALAAVMLLFAVVSIAVVKFANSTSSWPKR